MLTLLPCPVVLSQLVLPCRHGRDAETPHVFALRDRMNGWPSFENDPREASGRHRSLVRFLRTSHSRVGFLQLEHRYVDQGPATHGTFIHTPTSP